VIEEPCRIPLDVPVEIPVLVETENILVAVGAVFLRAMFFDREPRLGPMPNTLWKVSACPVAPPIVNRSWVLSEPTNFTNLSRVLSEPA
jgi:hypothetical protein